MASTTSAMSLKRIHREIVDVQKEDLGDIKLAPTDDLHLWKGSLPGPEGSVYEGGSFDVDIVLAQDYPFTAPRVVFKTRIYHMNISDQGNICIDILKNTWSPALSLFKVMLSLSSLLTDPNPKDPLVPGIASQYVQIENSTTIPRVVGRSYMRDPAASARRSTCFERKGKAKGTCHAGDRE
ncbi:ubiquitin-conjugating enzyme/RWD-like protein [Armillaria luteobubalina]|uniref:Ubiquitin-conjugating enzyme/RWD-like protein n=1 Tax=Armillaria luteobubalina TaxID=153913 RepID=A0AA39P530_9AGAR|nr:ubiquitin-conjugating enzyme/RWD-like protein [Armillaria luteobubalina]